MKTYRTSQYAKLKGVSRSYISKLAGSGRLKTVSIMDLTAIIDCPENDALFASAHPNRGKTIRRKQSGTDTEVDT